MMGSALHHPHFSDALNHQSPARPIGQAGLLMCADAGGYDAVSFAAGSERSRNAKEEEATARTNWARQLT